MNSIKLERLEILGPKLGKLTIKLEIWLMLELDVFSTYKFEAPLMKCDLFQALENTEIEAKGMGQNYILIYEENFRR